MQSHTFRYWLAVGVLAAIPALAMAQGENPVVIENVTWVIERYLGNGWGPPTPFTPGNELDLIFGAYLSGADVAHEYDLISVTVDFSDEDIEVTDDIFDVGEEFFYRKRSEWRFDPPFPPEPIPVPGDTATYVPLVNSVINAAAKTGTFTFVFQVPPWSGANQARLRDPVGHPYDVGWRVEIRLANSESPGDSEPWAERNFALFAVKNPANVEPNPPVYADAGADQTVAVGAAVTLNASQSFDGSNVGFDPLDPEVFLKDNLIVNWEWVSGPAYVEPVPDALDPFLAKVTLTTRGSYVFRVIVADGINPGSTSDLVTITVVNADELPSANLPPLAVISQPQPVVVGSIVTLDGRNSWDPNPEDALGLEFRWQQTNEIGGELTQDELVSSFQPLSGLRSSSDPNNPLYGADTWGRSTWRSVATGTYYFRLLVSDPLGGTAADMVAVQVVEATAGEYATRDGLVDADELSNTTAAPACGGGLLPLAMVPVVLWLSRGRRP